VGDIYDFTQTGPMDSTCRILNHDFLSITHYGYKAHKLSPWLLLLHISWYGKVSPALHPKSLVRVIRPVDISCPYLSFDDYRD